MTCSKIQLTYPKLQKPKKFLFTQQKFSDGQSFGLGYF